MSHPTGPTVSVPQPADTPGEVPTTRAGGAHASTGLDFSGPDAAGPVPGYQLLGKIGQGGMGTVYRARDERLDRDVAVKLLHDRLRGSPAAAARFLDEARITAQLQHPGVPPVHEVGTLPDGRPFLAMKLIKGRTLADRLADGSADRGALVAAFEQVCQAVGYAHNHGVIHRDLKPGNVMVGAFGEVQVMDWGLAKYRAAARAESPEATAASTFRDPRADGADGSETQPGSVLGTPAYMPPEQAIGAIDQIDERSDVFGLGAMLCAILTGRPPFVGTDSEGTRQQAARARLDEAFARLDACGVEPDLVALCRRCLSAEKADRPAHAGEVAAAVHGLRAAADERARRAEVEGAAAAARAAAERRRRKAVLALGGSLLALVAAAGAVAWLAQKRVTDRQRAETERVTHQGRARAGAEAALAQLPELHRRALWDQADLALGQAEGLLGPDADPDLTGRVAAARRDTAFLRRLDGIKSAGATLSASEFDNSPDLDLYAAAFADNGYDVLGGDPADLAARMNASAVREYLLAALDDWALATTEPIRFRRLVAVAAATTGHAWRRQLADAWVDGAKLEALYDAIPPAERSPAVISAVGNRLHKFRRDGVRRLEVGLRQHPDAFWLHYALGSAGGPGRLDARIGAYRAALAIRPTSAAAHSNLGILLREKKDLDGAIAEYREAIRLAPNSSVAHNNLGVALDDVGDLDGALAAYATAIRLNPRDPGPHYNRGHTLHHRGDAAGAIAAYREAARLGLKTATISYSVATVLREQGDADGAIAEYREAVRLDPNHVKAHNDLGGLLKDRGDLAGAIVHYEAAIRADPKYAMAYANLGSCYLGQGRLRESAAALRKATELRPADAQLKSFLTYVERALALDARLPAVRAGTDRPASPAESLDLAERAQTTRQYALAVRLATQAFAAEPGLARPDRRSEAARAAVRVAAGDDPSSPVGVDEWYYLTGRAYAWLTADLAAFRAGPAFQTPAGREHVRMVLTEWTKGRDLESVRDPKWLAAMPAEERARWERFWADVAAVFAQASRPAPKGGG